MQPPSWPLVLEFVCLTGQQNHPWRLKTHPWVLTLKTFVYCFKAKYLVQAFFTNINHNCPLTLFLKQFILYENNHAYLGKCQNKILWDFSDVCINQHSTTTTFGNICLLCQMLIAQILNSNMFQNLKQHLESINCWDLRIPSLRKDFNFRKLD